METTGIGKLRCEYKENPIGIGILRPRFSWQLKVEGRDVRQVAYQIQVATNAGLNILTWDTGRVESDQSVHVEYDGKPVTSRTRYFYRVKVWDNRGNDSGWSETAFFETGILQKDEWMAKWITPDLPRDITKAEPCPFLRSTFFAKSGVVSARVYVTSLGLYEFYLNGARVGRDLLTPGWTSYNKRLQYQTYDVTGQIASGGNAIGAILGDGWFKGYIGWKDTRNKYGSEVALLFQLHIQYEDGTEAVVTSDTGWKSATGPILMSEIYHGEIYDACLEKEDWSRFGYDDEGWSGVREISHTYDLLVAQENLSVRRMEELKPIEVLTTPKGDTVLDMGQNMVGWIRLSVQGPPGTKVILRHAEVLDKDGNFYTANLRGAEQKIEYIAKGTGKETFEPHFTFQGFRYVKVEGYPGMIRLEDFTGVVIHSEMEKTGSFRCSHDLVNQLQHNIEWGQKGNFVDIPTDCPQRDERLGWTGDAQVFVRTACFIRDVATFFTKWLRDLAADQTETGGVPYVIPHVLEETAHSSAAWADAAVICPWTVYLFYADRRILVEQYPSMKAWVDSMRRRGEEWYRSFHFGDWLGLDAAENSYVGATPRDYIAVAFQIYSTGLFVKMARILGKVADVEEYSKLYQEVLEYFRREFVTPNGRLAANTQTAHVLALMFDLVEEKHKKRIIDTLVNLLEEQKYHLTTGFVGTPYLCDVLSRYGRSDVAYKLLLQTDYPSWLYQVTKGATTIWEHWDGIKPDGSFWSEGMNSFNHYAYGSIGDWLYRVVAGLDTDEERPGYKHIRIKPTPGEGLTFAETELESMYGKVSSGWIVFGGTMEVNVTIPPNTTATVILPGASLDVLRESGQKVGEVEGIHHVENMNEGVELELGSGIYRFVYPKNA